MSPIHCAPHAPPHPAGPPIHHFDLYRLTQQYDLARLDLPASFSRAVCLVEWPERLAGSAAQPLQPLHVYISILAAAEQERLQAARHSGGSSRSGREAQQSEAADGDEAGGGSSGSSGSDDDDETGGDARWRRIQLVPAGPRWQRRLQLLRRYLLAEGAQLGCFVEEGGEA